MTESLLIKTDNVNTSDPRSDHSIGSALFQRRIQFYPARNTFKGLINGGSDFKLETLNPGCSSGHQRVGSGSGTLAPGGNKNDGSELSEFGLDPELCFGMTSRKIGAGLRNLGNTCFLNSVLQCLTYTEPLAAYLQSGKHKISCRVAGFCALCAMQNHVSRALQSSGRILSPEALVVNLRCISRNFRNARQEDAHEYMVNLLESMHKCCLPSGVPSESPSAYEKSLVHKIFGGRLQSQVKCQQCSNCSNKFDPFIDLSLEIFKADSLHKALANFTAAEWLDGGEKQYQCQRCKQKVRALKQLTIHKAPYVLAIHLKRFHSYDPGQKIKKKVQFGCALDLKPFVSGSYEGDLKYSLYGVLVHSGHSTHSGHYYCYVRTSNNMWYTLDDNRVSHVSEREVLNQQAYMLFYVRDIRSLGPRKPVDIAKQENMKMNVNANGVRTSSSLNQGLKKLIQNGPAETRFSDAFSSTAEASKNTLSVDSSKVSLSKDVSVQQGNKLILAESLMQGIKPLSGLSSQTQSQKDSQERISGKDHYHHNLKVLVAPAAEDVSRCYENGISKEDQDSLPIASRVHDPKNSAAKHVTSETSQKNNIVTVNVATPVHTRMTTSNSTDSSTSLMQQTNKGTQAEVSATGLVCKKTGGMMDEKAVGYQGLVLDNPVNRSLDMDVSNSKRLKKSKKKPLKYRVSNMHLGSNFFFMASLSLQKKKLKKSKCRTTHMKNLDKENLDRQTSSYVRSSMPGATGVIPLGSSRFECGATKSVYAKEASHRTPLNSNGESRMESVSDGVFRKRINQNSAVLATTELVEKDYGCGSLVNRCEVTNSSSLQNGKRDQMHNGLMSMVTGDLEETVVACWDDVELPPSQSTESKNNEVVSIGYIGDEWDEEYDRGKRKKLKSSKHSFGGPNPFQEIATMKSQSKRANHSSSGRPPFRIY